MDRSDIRVGTTWKHREPDADYALPPVVVIDVDEYELFFLEMESGRTYEFPAAAWKIFLGAFELVEA